MKIKKNKEQETLRQKGTRKYIERVIEEHEAEKEIKDYVQEDDDYEERIPNPVRPNSF